VDPADLGAAQRYFETTIFPNIRKLHAISLAEQGGNGFYFDKLTVKDTRAEEDFNPETRSWFKGAVANYEEAGLKKTPVQCYWTPIYTFHTAKEDGITISLAWKSMRGNYVVAAYDVLLDDFFKRVRELPQRESSLSFVFQKDGTPYIPDADEVEKSLAGKGYEAWKKPVKGSGSDLSTASGSDVRIERIRIDNVYWRCGFAELKKSQEDPLWICVMVPQAKLMGSNSNMLFMGIIVIVIASIAAIYLVFFMKRPKPFFEDTMDSNEIQDLINKGENRAVEFKSTMRMNLHAKKPGKEIELAWLKGVAGFLNTDGGILLLGVTDAGEITGLEQDVFENDDKCRLHFKNLIAAHLGADLSKYIRFQLLSVDGKTVGVVLCARASEPVFLKDGNKEHFYIRNGPSSDELPVSKALNYIKRRK
jgi:hypothetical protein